MMKYTSKGTHSFCFFQRLNREDYSYLENDFIGCMNKGELKRNPIKDTKGKNPDMTIGWEYTNKIKKGIRWHLLSFDISPHMTICGVKVIITPKVLIDNDYITAGTEDDIKTIEELFNKEAKKISPKILKFGLCSVSRADPCIYIDIGELNLPCTPRQMMKLTKRGDIPSGYKEREKYNKTSRRMKTDDDSFYLENGSVNINYYWKYAKINPKHPEYPNRDKYYNLLRLEVQPKYTKLYSISKGIRDTSTYKISDDDFSQDEIREMLKYGIRSPSIPIDIILSDDISDNLIHSYFYKILRKGDYFTLDGARLMVKRYNFRRDKEERLLYALDAVNEYRGIAKAKSKLVGIDLKEFKKSLKDLDTILINPVTIPRKWGIKYIPNFLKAYYQKVYDEQFLTRNEYVAHQYLTEYLSK